MLIMSTTFVPFIKYIHCRC